MAREFELDLSGFVRALNGATDAMANGAKRGMHDALDEWRIASKDIAPLDKGTLRDSSFGPNEIKGDGMNLTGEFEVSTTEFGKSGRFNYAYYLHEVKGEIANPTTPGTEAKFLDIPAKEHGEKWLRDIEDEIKKEVQKHGF